MSSKTTEKGVGKPILTDTAPAPVGAYSQGMQITGTTSLLFTSGQLPIDAVSGKLDVSASSSEQCAIALGNALAVVFAAGGEISNVVRVTVYLSDMTEFEDVNRTYEELLGSHRPARSVVGVAALPRGAKVEVELIATIP